ncbi:nitrate reductase [Limnohabitans sp. 2KL-3]|uniref:nitrate reductase n=1 Tax=Limnohabitans sp. 2KL-3 TaxID=1100700 RepID=UPI000B7CE208|nr:nitrate reductase [Limnohabitans sp. 2KL-3]
MIPITHETKSTCPYCGVGCGVVIASQGTQITGVRGDPDHPANFGRLCTKGQSLHLTAAPQVTAQTRLLTPQWRPVRGQTLQALGWSAAMDMASQRLAAIVHNHGPDALGFYISGQLLTEDYYVFNKLAKGLLGTNNIDSNSRLCMSSAVAGYKMTLGADAPPACYEDIAHAQCLFIAGSNAAWAHPILFRRIEDAKRANPALKMVVVDPRRTDTADMADLHLAIQPGTDVMLFHGLLHIMLAQGWTQAHYIATHTNGFEALQALVAEYTPQHVAQICGVPEADLYTAARWFAGVQEGSSDRTPTLSLYCQGLNQSSNGTAKNAALINLHLATQQIGRPGAGPLSLTGQPNAMGGREVGGMANLMSAHRDLANPQHRAEVAALWGVADVPAKPGLTAVEMFEAAADGQIKALWIACTNPAQSMPDQTTVRRALQRAEFVVVQEAFATAATCDYADLLLPATTWGEKEGTVTNSERRISRVRAAVAAPGQARADWAIAADLGQRLALALGRPQDARLMHYPAPESVWNEHRESTRGRDLDITGLSYAQLETTGPAQWPLPEGASTGQARLYADGRFPTADGRARFAAVSWQPVAEERVSQFPFSLTTGRLRDQWHGMTRTGTAGRLFAHSPEPCVQMNPQDAQRLGLQDGDLVQVRSKRGSLVLPVQSSSQVAASQAFIAMHWGPEVLSGRNAQGEAGLGVNVLTTSSYCATSKQPELKHAAVQITRAALSADASWQVVAMAWLPSDTVWTVRQQLQKLLPQFDFAYLVPFTDAHAALSEQTPRTGLLLRAACRQPAHATLLHTVAEALGLNHSATLHYQDAVRMQRRSVHLSTPNTQGLRSLQGFLVAGDSRSGRWLKTLLQEATPLQWPARQWLMASDAPPEGATPVSRQVCSCLNVRENAIAACLQNQTGSEDQRLAMLQSQLRCGTQCGSCVPELRQIIRLVPQPT